MAAAPDEEDVAALAVPDPVVVLVILVFVPEAVVEEPFFVELAADELCEAAEEDVIVEDAIKKH